VARPALGRHPGHDLLPGVAALAGRDRPREPHLGRQHRLGELAAEAWRSRLDPQDLESVVSRGYQGVGGAGALQGQRHRIALPGGHEELERVLSAHTPGARPYRDARDLEAIRGVRGEPRAFARSGREDRARGRTLQREALPGRAGLREPHVVRDDELAERREQGRHGRLLGLQPEGALSQHHVDVRDDAADPRQQQRVAARAIAAGGERRDVIAEHAVEPAHAVGALDHHQAPAARAEEARAFPAAQRLLAGVHGPKLSGSPDPSAGAP
jgi:hypothetical protein